MAPKAVHRIYWQTLHVQGGKGGQYQEYMSSESVQLPWIAFLHIDVTSSGENYITGGVVV